MLEEIFTIYFYSNKTESNTVSEINRCDSIYEYEKKINKLYKRKEIESKLYFFINNIIEDIDKNRQCFYDYKDGNTNKCKELIEKILEYIFGLKRVYLYTIKETDYYYTIFNAEIYAQPYYKSSLINYKEKKTIYYNKLDIDKEIIYNGNEEITISQARKYIKCSLVDGLYFTKYNPIVFILLPEKINTFYFTIKEWIAILLHEIGHVFSYIILGNIDIRVHEDFADRFLSLYGYGGEFINSKRKELSTRIYLNKKNKNNEITSLQYFTLFGIKREYNININNHACIYTRCENILNQIKYIRGNIKEVKKYFSLLKQPYYISNIDIKDKLYIKQNYLHYINNFHLNTIERLCNKIYKLDKRKFMGLIRKYIYD